MNCVALKVKAKTPRLYYICDTLFKQFLSTDYQLYTENEDCDQIHISYGFNSNGDCITIPDSEFLHENGIRPFTPKYSFVDGTHCLFYSEEFDEFDLPFDLFSMVFYLITRYEEYGHIGMDQYGRFPSKDAIAVKHDFIDYPIIDIWLKRLVECISKKCGVDIFLSNELSVLPTIDIDLPYAFKFKKIKSWAGILRDLAKFDISTLKSRIHYLSSGEDPFDTYEYLRSQLSNSGVRPVLFFLNRCEGTYDNNHLSFTSQLCEILQECNQWATIGMHPSLHADSNLAALREEKEFIEQCINLEITKSRQHFLRLRLSESYEALLALGIKEDYSMAYPDRAGFRASTSRPFKWYNVKEEKVTELTIIPTVLMDVTLKIYMGLSTEKAIEKVKSLYDIVSETGGYFSYIWHNSSLSDAYGWKNWNMVFEALIELGKKE